VREPNNHVGLRCSGFINIRQDENYPNIEPGVTVSNHIITINEKDKTIYIERPLEDYELEDNQ